MIVLLAGGVPVECMSGTFNSYGWIALAVTLVGLASAIYSLSKGFEWLREEADCKRDRKEPPDRRTAKNWLLGSWVLLPPVWFFIEYIFLYRSFGKAACFESFKYAQELAILSGLYFGQEILGKKER